MARDSDDVALVQRFQAWIKEQRELRNFSYADCADNYNATLQPSEKPLGPTAMRRLEDRTEELGTIRRDTCRRVAKMLTMDVNQVLMKAGYMPDDAYLQIDELPTAVRVTYGGLDTNHKARVHDFVRAQWEEQVEQNARNAGNLPEDVRRRYALLPEEAKKRLHRLIEFEASDAVDVV